MKACLTRLEGMLPSCDSRRALPILLAALAALGINVRAPAQRGYPDRAGPDLAPAEYRVWTLPDLVSELKRNNARRFERSA
jgi:hypothetical protein